MESDGLKEPSAGVGERLLRAVIALQSQIVRAGLDLDDVMQTVVAEIPVLLPVASGAVVERRYGDEMVYEAVSGMAGNTLGLRLPLHGTLSGACVIAGKPLYARDCETDERVNHTIAKQLEIRSMICVPLIGAETTVGAIKAFSREFDAFTDEDVHVLELMAAIIGASMYNAIQFRAAVDAGRVDALTGLGNRRAFDEDFAGFVARARRSQEALSLAIIDLDGFKALNDRHGHAAGDAALANFGTVLRAFIRSGDRAYRLGGDEFAIVLPIATQHAAQTLMERLHQRAANVFMNRNALSLSAGVAELDGGDDAHSIAERADAAMYANKIAKRSA